MDKKTLVSDGTTSEMAISKWKPEFSKFYGTLTF
jgi:hypothetical protein